MVSIRATKTTTPATIGVIRLTSSKGGESVRKGHHCDCSLRKFRKRFAFYTALKPVHEVLLTQQLTNLTCSSLREKCFLTLMFENFLWTWSQLCWFETFYRADLNCAGLKLFCRAELNFAGLKLFVELISTVLSKARFSVGEKFLLFLEESQESQSYSAKRLHKKLKKTANVRACNFHFQYSCSWLQKLIFTKYYFRRKEAMSFNFNKLG